VLEHCEPPSHTVVHGAGTLGEQVKSHVDMVTRHVCVTPAPGIAPSPLLVPPSPVVPGEGPTSQS